MNLKVKSSFIIVVTFVLGLVVGSIFTKSFFRPPDLKERWERIRKPEGFMENFEDIIRPSDSQREQIRDILRHHFERMHSQSDKFREGFKVLNDSLRMELDPILDNEQKERLDKMQERMKEQGRQGFGPRKHPKRRNPEKRKIEKD